MVEDSAMEIDQRVLFWERFRFPILIGVLGLICLVLGVRFLAHPSEPQIEFVENSTASATIKDSVVEIAGAVEAPGVYTLPSDSRIQDLLIAAHGLGSTADREYVAKYINLAARVADGSKIYIPEVGETVKTTSNQAAGAITSTLGASLVSINTGSQSDLESLPGVGEVTAGKIISGRPYSAIFELKQKKVVNNSTYEKIKEKISL